MNNNLKIELLTSKMFKIKKNIYLNNIMIYNNVNG